MFSYHYLIETFKTIIICSTFFIMFLFVLIRIILFLFLEKASRPNISDSPYSTFFDRFLPILFLVTPFLLIIIFKPFDSWFPRLLLLISIHIVILIPLLHYWSHLRSWSIFDNNPLNDSWYNPHVFKHLSIALIYPLLWGIFFSFSRYLRLGSSFSLLSFLTIFIDYIICFCFLIPFYYSWFLILNFFVKNLKEFLWHHTEIVLYNFHLWALQYYDYFRICQLIHKSYFILFDLFFQYPGAFYKIFNDLDRIPLFVRFTKIFQYLYYNTYICHMLFIISIVTEIILNKGILFYSIYTLFIYPLLFSFLKMYNIVGSQELVKNMCKSDYLYKNFEKPRYYINFWFFAKNPRFWYNFSYEMDPALLNIFEKNILLETAVYIQFIKYHKKLLYRVHGYTSTKIVVHKTPYPRIYGIKYNIQHPLMVRIAAAYKSTYNVRWFHTTRILLGPRNLLHPYVGKKLTDPFLLLSLLNEEGQNINFIQACLKTLKILPQPNQLYIKTPNVVLGQTKTFMDLLETNFVFRFRYLALKGVIIGTYKEMKAIYGYNNLETMQLRPDLVSLWLGNNSYQCKNYIGIDEKHRSPSNFGRNQAINNITPAEYSVLITEYKNDFTKKHRLTPEIDYVLNEFVNIISEKNFNSEKYLDFWSDNLHLFPGKWRPPFYIQKIFDDRYFKPEIIQRIREGQIEIKYKSDELYVLQGNKETGNFSEEAINYFEDSCIQEFLRK